MPANPSRRQLLSLAAHLGLLSLLPALPGRVLAAGGEPGTISVLKGQAFVNGQKATRTTRVPPGAEVRTGARSMVAFAAGGDAHVLRSNSTVVLRRGSGSFSDQVRLVAGSLLSAWGKRPEGQEVQLLTRTATIGIRGTATDADDENFSLLSGSARYTNNRNGRSENMQSNGNPLSRNANGQPSNRRPPVNSNELNALRQAASNINDPTLQQQVGNLQQRLGNNGGNNNSYTGNPLNDLPAGDLTGGSGSGVSSP